MPLYRESGAVIFLLATSFSYTEIYTGDIWHLWDSWKKNVEPKSAFIQYTGISIHTDDV